MNIQNGKQIQASTEYYLNISNSKNFTTFISNLIKPSINPITNKDNSNLRWKPFITNNPFHNEAFFPRKKVVYNCVLKRRPGNASFTVALLENRCQKFLLKKINHFCMRGTYLDLLTCHPQSANSLYCFIRGVWNV